MARQPHPVAQEATPRPARRLPVNVQGTSWWCPFCGREVNLSVAACPCGAQLAGDCMAKAPAEGV